ncbi:MAG: F0F1 ATP synthase subunit epsilon [Gammaproteobacteria bacterium]|nr:F0F1 ATP synthase subunit epsilon [Gammaproteobacteria bacterium]
MPNIQVDIVSAEKEIWSGQGSMVFAPGEVGELGIAPGHTPLITKLNPGDVRVLQENEEEQFFFISGGILEVQPHVVTILSDVAVRGGELDEASANEAKQRAEEAMKDGAAELDYAQAKAELANAVAQLRSIEKLRKLRQ